MKATINLNDQDAFLEEEISNRGFLITKLEDLIGWSRANSLWPMSFGFGMLCC